MEKNYATGENEAIDFLSQSPFSRIFLTPDLGENINWIKEGNKLIDR